VLRESEKSVVYAAAAIPVWVGESIFGIMEFYATKPQPVDHKALEVLDQVGTHLGRVIEREQVERARLDQHKAEVANEAKGAFLANMSHEIRTPMNGIIGLSEILDGADLPPQEAAMVHTIHSSGQALLRILDDILDMSKIEAGKVRIHQHPVDLSEMLSGVLEAVLPMADKNHVDMLLLLDTNLPGFVQSDETRLRQILLNLLSNAVKFSRPDATNDNGQSGSVTLEVHKRVDEIEFAVIDNGIGIGPEKQKQLFKPFSQVEETTTRRFGGTGLGLMISKSLTEMMDGRIAVDSTEGAGSTFCVTFPLIAAESETARPDASGLTIVGLVDEVVRREVVSDYISAVGSSISFHTDPDAVARLLDTSPAPDVLLVGLTGEQDILAEHARFAEAYPDLPILLISRQPRLLKGIKRALTQTLRIVPMLPARLFSSLASFRAHIHGEVDVNDETTAVQDDPGCEGQPGLSVLVVEDNVINQEVIALQLTEIGHRYSIAENGQAGLQQLSEAKFDIALVDCHMPVMDGYTMVRNIRQAEGTDSKNRLPVIAVTANALEGEAGRCVKAGFDDYLSKPMSLTDLKAMVAKWSAPDGPQSTPIAEA